MHILVCTGILLVVMPSLIQARLDRKESARSKLLRAIFREDRTYDRPVSFRGPFECCPSKSEKFHPRGGLSRDNKLLELYRDSKTVQGFHETRCLSGVSNRNCKYLSPEVKKFSRCVQKYTYTYAIVRDFNVSQPYRVDYIRIKSGCSCEIYEPVIENDFS